MHLSKHPWLIRLSLALSLLVGAGGATMAQSLADYTPAGSLIALGFWQDAEPGQNLREDLAALDWEAAFDTLQRTAEATGATEDLEMLMDLFVGPSLSDSVDFCPAAAELWSTDDYSAANSSALVSIGFSPFNPTPAFTMLAELNDTQDALTGELVDVLLDCAMQMDDVDILELDQDGVPFWQATVDFQASFAFSHQNGILAVSTSADQLRYSLRLQAGSDEPSLADNRLHDSWTATERGDGGFSWLVDYNVIADLVMVFGPALEADELTEALAAAFRTAGGVVGSLTQGTQGLVYESELLPDRSGGDQELFDLLLSTGLSLPEVPVLPAGATGVSSYLINVQAAMAYFQGWLDGIGAMAGENLDIRELLAEEGLNLDSAFLNWLGNDIHMVQLETSTASLSSLVRGAASFVAVQTTDPGAAMAGANELIDFFLDLTDTRAEGGFDIGLDRRTGEYRGTDYVRLRVGPTTDVAFTTLDAYLVIGMPASALHVAIDQFLDGGPVTDLPARPAGTEVLSAYWLDGSAELHSFADLADLAVQPLAWAAQSAALSEAQRPTFDYWDDQLEGSPQDWSADDTYGNHDVSSEEYEPLAVNSSATANLPAAGAAFWLLDGISAGDTFHVRMESEDLDAMLELYELETGRQVAFNDDYSWMDGLHAQIDYVAREGVTYVVKSESWGFSPGEEYVISLAIDTDSADAVEVEEIAEEVTVPAFGEFLDLFELGPKVLRIVADSTGELEGFQERRGDTLYTRYVLHNTW